MTGSSTMMTALEAAHHMGITLELLYYYTSDGFVRTTGFDRLRAVDSEGTTMFAREELDALDQVLAGEWSSPPDARAGIPQAIQFHLRAEASNACGRCGKGAGVQNAHIVPWETSKSNHHQNLVRICSACHVEHDLHNSLSTQALQAVKDKLVARTRNGVRLRIDGGPAKLTIPRANPHFVGRSEDLDALVQALREGQSTLVTGVGGSGKTELLVQALHRLGTGRPVLWIDVEHHRSTIDVVSALRWALAKNGEPCPQQEIPFRLDELDCILVFDGLEQSNIVDMEAFEDMVGDLMRWTAVAQFAVTSQVVLQTLPFSFKLKLGSLDHASSMQILGGSSSSVVELGAEADPLLAFCEGHPLTLRIANALLSHYGSTSGVMSAIESSGAAALQFPSRGRQGRTTSLAMCLSVAYDALPGAARRMLWSLANLPAGLFSHFVEDGALRAPEPLESLAQLRRWHLIEATRAAPDVDRLKVLRPVREFVVTRAAIDDKDAYGAQLHELVSMLEMQAAFFESNPEINDDPERLFLRYGHELPNLVHVAHLARSEHTSPEIRNAAIAISSSLMRHFFVVGPRDQGCGLMLDAADLAMQTGRNRKAAGLVLQAIALAQRDGNELLVDEAAGVAARLENSVNEPEAIADLAMCRAVHAEAHGNPQVVFAQATRAYTGYTVRLRAAIRKRTSTAGSIDAVDQSIIEAHGNVSSALGLLGSSLLAMGDYARARSAYQYSLRHQRGNYAAVNKGQVLHQMGNCESHLGNFAAAQECYLAAAGQFAHVGMSGYISNAIGELGMTLLDVEAWRRIDKKLIVEGVVDIEAELRSAFGNGRHPGDHECRYMLRKLCGTVVLITLKGVAEPLASFIHGLHDEVVVPALTSMRSDRVSPVAFFIVKKMQEVLVMGHLAVEAEGALQRSPEVPFPAIEGMLQLAGEADGWSREHLRLADWIHLLLARTWGIAGASRDEIHEFVDPWAQDEPTALSLSRTSSTFGNRR